MDTGEKFAKFINARFIAWENGLGSRGTVSNFAKAVDAYQGDVSHWLKGTRVPGFKVLLKLSQNPIVGPEVWEAAGYGYMVKDPLQIRTLAALETLPRPLQEWFADQAERKAREHTQEETGLSFQAAAG
jgi:hypothetical protein